MEVPRRIELMPVAPIQKKETKKETAPTIRFNLDLAEPTEKTCPEFSYEELLRNALGPKENGTGPNINGTNPDDPFGDDADDAKMRALAQSFEAKYGGGGGPNKKSRKQRDRLEDLVDLGEGYDDEDSFIDNTEAYDELVPACLETKHGGFYINAGKLDFREIRSESDDDFESPKRRKKKRKKMSINSDSEEEEKKVPPKKKFSHKNVLIKKRKKLSSSGSVDGNKPQKKVKLGADGLPKKRGLKHDKEKSRPKVKKTPPSVEELIQQQVKSTTTNNNQLSESTSNVPANETIVLDSSISKLHSDTSNHGESGEERSKSPKPETAPKIPDNVSPSLKENVEKIKEAAKASQESKSKFFNASVNKLLLGIETESQALPPSVRKIIYTHLAAFLPVGIQALTKRAKKLRLNEQDDKLKEPINRLREAIAKAMPEQMEKYNIEVQLATKAYQEKQQLLQQQKQEQKDDNPATVESDDEKKDGDKNAEMKRFKAPNKKFQWTEGLRMLLCTVVRIKMNMFDAGNSRTQSAEEFLRAYLDTEVKPLWPQGWMQTRMLYKESKNAHNRWTSGPVQPKPPKKPVISESGVASVNSSQIADTSSSLLDVSANTSVARTPASKEEKPLISHPTPTLLDYATKSYYSAAKSKVASTPAPKSELSGASQGTPITTKSITTPAVTPIGTSEDGGEALRSMSMLAGLASSRSPSEKPKEQATTTAQGSSPPSLTQQVSTGFMPDQSSDFMAQFREFAKSFQQESRDSPPVLNLTNSSQISALKQAWDQANKTKENKSKLPADQTVTKVKLQSRTVNVVKVKPKQTSGVSTITTDSNSPQTSISTGDKSKGNFTVAGSVSETPASSAKAAPFAQQNVTTPPVWSHGTSFADTASGASKMQENKHRLQGDQREKLTQLAMKTQIAKPTEEKRQQIQQSHSQKASVTNMSKSLGNGLFSPPSSSPQSLHSMHSSQTVKPSVGPVTSQVPQQQLHKHPMQQQTPRTSPSPNRNSPVTPPRSSPGSLYNSLALLNQAQMQAQTLQQQQRTAAPTNSQTMWRSVDQTAKASRSPNSSSAFTLPSGLQRSPAAVASDFFPHQARNTNSGTSGYPGIHMVDLSKAQQAHDIAASMRSPSSPAHTGPGLYSPSLQNQGVGSLNHHSLLGSHTSPQAHRAQSLYSGVHRGSPIAPGTPPFSSHPYADPGQQYH